MTSGDSTEFKPDLYVIARIITVLHEHGPMNRTNLATAIGLSYDRAMKYLTWMSSKELIIINGDGYVRLTRKGEETYLTLVQWVINYVGRLRFPRKMAGNSRNK
ncbi:winged helix-turn-helix domain-containing protein [Vulcanisaeta distributa]|uniref:winged helix-turn-helix domain-containing protein n=1 Tax=Vulcanisaeta distributa TaxID=164451 RepID=UPI0006D131CB|nr:winged helix-turn-helix domain-containing protein [Vulcanisaeta distributa]